jgi:hypothetical protein
MRKDIGTTSLLAILVLLAAGILLSVQAQRAGEAPWHIAAWLLWTLELALYAVALFVWQPNLAWHGLALGLIAMLALRHLTASGAAVAGSLMPGAPTLRIALVHSFDDFYPRIISIGFSLLMMYPLRLLLPARASASAVVPPAPSWADWQPTATTAAPTKDEAELTRTLGRLGTIVLMGGQSPTSGELALEVMKHGPITSVAAARHYEGSVTVTLAEVLDHLPIEAGADTVREKLAPLAVKLPLDLIVPQLKEGQVLLSPAQLATYLPEEAVTLIAGLRMPSPKEAMIALPLRAILPQLPPEVLALPVADPPPWATAVDKAERLPFAGV